MKKIAKPHKARKPQTSTDVPSFARGKDQILKSPASLQRHKKNELGEFDNGKDGNSLIEETAAYNAWRQKLPSNLRTETPDYDLYGAFKAGLQPEWNDKDKSYHLGSRDPRTGKMLKRSTHPTFSKAVYEDMAMGYYPIYKNGQIYTINPLDYEKQLKPKRKSSRKFEKNKRIDERISKISGYGWNNDTETNTGYGWNREGLKRSVNPSAAINGLNAIRYGLSYFTNNDYTTDEGYREVPGSKAMWERHLGFPRNYEWMPITGIRFSGDYNLDGSLKFPNAEYTGIPKQAKNSILRKIKQGKLEVNPYGKWSLFKDTFYNNDFYLEPYGDFSVRENNRSGIYDMFDTYDFDDSSWYKPDLNRLPGTQIEVRDTIWGPNAIPELYDEDFSTKKANYLEKVLDFNKGKDSGIHIKKKNRGKFTALKKRTGKSASWFKEHGTPAQKKMAVFALNARKWKH